MAAPMLAALPVVCESVKFRLKTQHIGFIASALIGTLGYAVGAPLEAVLALVGVGTVLELLLFPPRRG
ncbi:hypothetical protein [Parahaliea mediterranea]|uniref:hypothetical protein n=1 Tax=Parahaliea mediterranea TaxID=651086 RepID=UPI0013005881|nr:hypothetical protein [Parahaliea mediterranea]